MPSITMLRLNNVLNQFYSQLDVWLKSCTKMAWDYSDPTTRAVICLYWCQSVCFNIYCGYKLLYRGMGNGEDPYPCINVNTCFRRSYWAPPSNKLAFLKYVEHRNACWQLKADYLKRRVSVPISTQCNEKPNQKGRWNTNYLYKNISPPEKSICPDAL